MNDLQFLAEQFFHRHGQPVALPESPPVEFPLAGAIERLQARFEATDNAFERQLAAMPNQKPCGRHPGQVAVLLVEKSWAAKQPVYGCPECADDVRTRRRVRRMDAAGIPSDVRHATLENFDTARPGVVMKPGSKSPAEFVEAARQFMAGDYRNGLFTGTPGIGKGHLGAAIALDALDAGRDVVWIDCASLFTAYHQAYSSGDTDRVVVRNAFADLLVLDEICLRDLPADGEEILFAILDKRHKAGRQTVMLSNKPGKAIREWFGGRIYDRLKSGDVLYCYGEWESMRGKSGDGSGDEF